MFSGEENMTQEIKSKRIFLIGWDNISEELVNVVLRLRDGGHKILYWSSAGGEDKYIDTCKKKFKNTIFHRRQDARFGIPPEEYKDTKFEPPSEELIKQFYETESILATMKNFEKISKFTPEKKYIYHNMLGYWRGVIKRLKPDVIIFALWPHDGYNYLVYSMAKFLRIKTIIFESSIIAGRHLLINDIKIGSTSLKNEIKHNKKKYFKVGDLNSDIRANYENQAVVNKETYKLLPELEKFYRRQQGIKLFYKKIKMVLTSITDFSFVGKAYNYIIKQFKSNIKKEYKSQQSKPDINKKFIYVALHFQPECSTSPLGSVFVDQVLMIKILSASIPRGWLIYVKEHPYQWMPGGLSFFNFRYQDYYRSIAGLKNVHLVPIKTSPAALINRSLAVATVTGTSGWEAVLKLKPVLNFGYAWYRDCPGVFRVNSVGSCKKIIEKIQSGFKISNQDIINYLVSFDKISFRCYFGKYIKNQSGITEDKNTKNIYDILKKELAKQEAIRMF